MVYAKPNSQAKANYLADLFHEAYFKDIPERNNALFPNVLEKLTDVLCSNVGSLTNVSKLQRSIQSARHSSIDDETIAAYLKYLTENFLFKCSRRYDIKGKRYFDFPSKYYCADLGLRNAAELPATGGLNAFFSNRGSGKRSWMRQTQTTPSLAIRLMGCRHGRCRNGRLRCSPMPVH